MLIEPSATDREFARKVHRLFAAKPGSERIATDFALAHLAAILRQHRPRSVLEFGAGIGTITHLLLAHPARPERVLSTEENAFCLQQLENNISPELRQGWTLIPKERLGEYQEPFDLIIIDGHVMGIDLSAKMKPGTIIFAEGNRKPERAWMQELAARQGLAVDFTNHPRGRRWFFLQWTRHKKRLPWPRIRLFMKMKGCWVGRVSPKAG